MRFHVGCSFSWRTIKKFLIPFIIGLLAFLGFSGIKNDSALGFIKVNALVNNETTYNLTMHDYNTSLNNIVCGNETLKSVVDNFIDNFDDTYFDLFIATPNVSNPNYETIDIFLVNKMSLDDFYVSGNYTSSPYVDDYLEVRFPNIPYSSSYKMYKYQFNTSLSGCNNTNFTDMQVYTDLVNAMNTGVSSASYITEWSISRDYSNYTFDNINDYDITDWYYYSSKPLQYNFAANNKTLNSSSTFYKSLYIVDNDTTYTFNNNEELPSYYDIYHNSNPSSSTFIEYKPKLGTIYTNFIPSQVSNFSLNIKFDTEDITGYDYFHNLEYFWNCYGRVNHNNNYYTYEKFSYCSFEQWDESSLDSNKFDVTFNNLEIYDQQDNVITDFSNYDKLFFYLDFQYKDSSLNQTLSSINISFNGNVHIDDRFSGVIYENFESLTLYSKMFISSTKNDYSYFMARYSGTTLSDRYFLYKQQFDISSLNGVGEVSFLGTTFQRLSVNKAYNLGYLIFQQITNQNSGLDLPKVDLIIFDDIVISLNNINSNNVYYVDSNGNISNGSLNIQYDNIVENQYDLDYYFRIVHDYIDSYKDKIWDLHLTIQNFYDSTPILLQNTIYVLFILLCITFIYKEIRR